MRLLEIDIGNTNIKWRFLVGGELSSRGILAISDYESFSEKLDGVKYVDEIWVASVASPSFESNFSDILFDIFGKDPWFAAPVPYLAGVTNGYEDFAALGVDRWLVILAAWARFKKELIVVDSGTALTIDMVDGNGQHLGGYIIPGVLSMEHALFSNTANVEFKDPLGYDICPGRDTKHAVRHGAVLAQVGSLQAAFSNILASVMGESPLVVFCGGGGQLLQKRSDLDGFWLPDLVFEGLEIAAGELL